MQISECFTARFAQDAESAEINDFSIAVERTAMEKCSVHLRWKIIILSGAEQCP